MVVSGTAPGLPVASSPYPLRQDVGAPTGSRYIGFKKKRNEEKKEIFFSSCFYLSEPFKATLVRNGRHEGVLDANKVNSFLEATLQRRPDPFSLRQW